MQKLARKILVGLVIFAAVLAIIILKCFKTCLWLAILLIIIEVPIIASLLWLWLFSAIKRAVEEDRRNGR